METEIRITRIDLPFTHCVALMIKLWLASLVAGALIGGTAMLLSLLFGVTLFSSKDPDQLLMTLIVAAIAMAAVVMVVTLLRAAIGRRTATADDEE